MLSFGLKPPQDAALHEIVAHLDDGDTVRALELLRPRLVTGKDNLAPRFLVAMTAWVLERYDWAVAVLRECHAEAPENGGIAEALASLEAQLGHLDESLYLAKLASAFGSDPALEGLTPKCFPGFDKAFLSIVEHPLLGKARRLFAEGKLADAIEQARQHVAIEPDDLAGRCFYAACLLRSGAACAAAETLAILDDAGAATAEQASLYARTLAATGAHEAALRWHAHAAAMQPEAAEIVAAQIADAPFLSSDTAEMARLASNWAARFALAPKPSRKYAVPGKLVIGYLVSALVDAGDAAAVAAVAQAHDRQQVAILGFGCGIQTAEHNAALIGSFTKWRDIGALDPATLARILSADGVDVLVDAGGFASALQLRALSRCSSAVRVSWLGNPAPLLAPFYDTRLESADYPILLAPGHRRREGAGFAFGSDVTMAQLEEETVQLWRAILDALPGAKLVLRARDMDRPENVARLIARFGNAHAARIDLRSAETAADFYPAIDVALAPLKGASPRAAAEALAYGVPVIAMKGAPYGAFLAGRGLLHWVAEDRAQYRAQAIAMAAAPEKHVVPPLDHGATKLARKIESLAGLARTEKIRAA